MRTIVEEQLRSEILLCDAIAALIAQHDYSIYDVRAAVGAFTGEILGRMGTDQRAAALASPRLSVAAGSEQLHSRWAEHSNRYPGLIA